MSFGGASTARGVDTKQSSQARLARVVEREPSDIANLALHDPHELRPLPQDADREKVWLPVLPSAGNLILFPSQLALRSKRVDRAAPVVAQPSGHRDAQRSSGILFRSCPWIGQPLGRFEVIHR